MKFGVFSPGGYVEPDDLKDGLAWIEACGHEVLVHSQTYARWHQLAGRDEEKIQAFHDLLKNDEIEVIWCATGGNRVLQWLDKVNWKLVNEKQKRIIGFSECTALLNAAYAKSDLTFGFHAPVIKTIPRTLKDAEILLEFLTHTNASLIFECQETIVLNHGEASGRLIGGNMSAFCALTGTPFMPDCSNALLFFEEINEEISKFDRMLGQLYQSGILKQASGLLFGSLTNMTDNGRPYGLSCENCVSEIAKNLNIPVIMNAPFGHETRNVPLPFGQLAQLNTDPISLKLK